MKLQPNEIVIEASETSQNDIPGKLIITNRRIMFIISANAYTFQESILASQNFEILYNNIKDVVHIGEGCFQTKKLLLMTCDGKSYEFSLLKKRDIISKLILVKL